MNYQKIVKCRVSKKKDLILVGKFKGMSLTGIFPKTINQKIPYLPFEVVYSKKSQLLQLKHNYNPNLLYGNSYGYMSRLNPVMVEHLKKKSKILRKKINFKKNDFILDIGSNDGTFLNFFNGFNSYAVDPSISQLKRNYNKNIKKIPFIFEKAFTFVKKKRFKLISAIAMFYDLKDPIDFMNKTKKILRKDGIFHIEVAYLPEIIKRFSYDTFCQEHYEYYSMLALEFLCNKTNMKIVDFGFNNINGGSIWLNIAHQNSAFKSNSKKIKKQISLELKEKINKPDTYRKYFKKVLIHGNQINSIIKKINDTGKNVYALGASTKGNVILQNAKLDNTLIKGVFDVNRKKFNKFTPHSKIKILDEKKIKSLKVDYVLLLIWHFNKFIINKIKKLNRNIKIIIPFPKIKII
jgi:SAM-dependent methyltransferase